MNSKDEFLFHYSCEWDTTDFLSWDEVCLCIDQLYGGLEAENKRLRIALEKIRDNELAINKTMSKLYDGELREEWIKNISLSCKIAKQTLKG